MMCRTVQRCCRLIILGAFFSKNLVACAWKIVPGVVDLPLELPCPSQFLPLPRCRGRAKQRECWAYHARGEDSSELCGLQIGEHQHLPTLHLLLWNKFHQPRHNLHTAVDPPQKNPLFWSVMQHWVTLNADCWHTCVCPPYRSIDDCQDRQI